MAKPRPIPCVFLPWELSRKPKSLNNFFWSCLDIPIPVSCTDIFTKSSDTLADIVMVPSSSINLSEFDNRLRTICRILWSSEKIKSSQFSYLVLTFMFFLSALYYWMFIMSWIHFLISNHFSCFLNLPFFICDKSRRSLVREIIIFEEQS